MTFRTFFRNTAQNEDGLALIEVVITTMIVALILVGTLTGFQDINRVSADERFHDEATLLAAQSQEQLRSDPASTLNLLVGQSSHMQSYPVKVDGTAYTITQEANYFNESKPSSDCLATAASESSAKNDGDYLRVTSRVTWPQLTAAGREAVSESSIVTPPDGSALEVDATNGASPEASVSGVTSVITYTGVEATEPTTLEGTTGVAGCVVFGGIPATSGKVEIKELPGYVTTSGSVKVPVKEVTIAPNITTHDPVVINEGGAITAKFTYNKGTENVNGDTFVAYFGEAINPATEYTVGSTKFEYEASGEHKYKSLTGAYAHSATTPMGTSYSKGDLFPFPYLSTTKKKWIVFAGDCKENNANTNDNAVENGEAIVLPGKTTEVSIPMANLAISVYSGTSTSPGKLETTNNWPVKITDTACESAPTPNNASGVKLEHIQATKEGHLEDPNQPFGKAKLCLAYNTTGGSAVHYTYTIAYSLVSTEPHTDTIYLTQAKNYSGPDPVTFVKSSSTISC